MFTSDHSCTLSTIGEGAKFGIARNAAGGGRVTGAPRTVKFSGSGGTGGIPSGESNMNGLRDAGCDCGCGCGCFHISCDGGVTFHCGCALVELEYVSGASASRILDTWREAARLCCMPMLADPHAGADAGEESNAMGW